MIFSLFINLFLFFLKKKYNEEKKRMRILFIFLIFNFYFIHFGLSIAPCLSENPDICGFYPSDYPALGVGGVPPLCNADCSLVGEFDLCGICDGIAPITQKQLLATGLPALSRIGGSVATWNGTVAASQHLAQDYTAIVNVPVITWNLNPVTGVHSSYVLPVAPAGVYDTAIPQGVGFALVMSQNFLVVGSHASTKKVVQLWKKTLTAPPWALEWTAYSECPGTYEGFSVAIDENIPKGIYPGVYGVIAAGNPNGFISGYVVIHLTYSPGIIQTIRYGPANYSESICFGESVSSDSGLLAVGAPRFTYSSQQYSGSVFIYRWNPTLVPKPQYELVVQIPPPVPTLNGGFGLSVGVWNDLVTIGDNMGGIYLYQIVGSFALPIVIDQPVGLPLETMHGHSVSIWDNYIASGDERFTPYVPLRGSTFVWDRNPLFSTFYRLMYQLEDIPTSISSRYGADVDNRGGCYVVSGIPQQAPYGGVYVTNLCREVCKGCDGVLNSCELFDACGVCSGDNSTCIDCTGKLYGTAKLDACGVCKGTNKTCVLPAPVSITTNCDTTVKRNLTHAFQTQWGNAVWTIVAPFPTKGTASISTVTVGAVVVSTLTYHSNPYTTGSDSVRIQVTLPSTGASAILIVPVNIATCVDCFNVTNGPARFDLCGVCNGTNSTCNGCDGVPASGKVNDICGVCNGNGLSCLNITTNVSSIVNCTAQIIFPMSHEPASTPVSWVISGGPSVGSAYVNPSTGLVIWQNPAFVGSVWFVVQATSLLNSSVVATKNLTFTVLNCSDCSGNQLGTQLVDVCGVCGGNGLSCIDCLGIPFGNATYDCNNICNGPNTNCDESEMPTWFLYFFIIIVTVGVVFLLWNFMKLLFGEVILSGPPSAPEIPNIPKQRNVQMEQPELLPNLSPDQTLVRRTNIQNKANLNYPNSLTIPITAKGIGSSIGASTSTEYFEKNNDVQNQFKDIYDRGIIDSNPKSKSK